MADWTFLTNHALVLVTIARDPEVRLRDVADQIGITERSAHRIVTDLVESGYLLRERVGARNRYQVRQREPLRHPLVRDHHVHELLQAVGTAED